MATLTNPRAGQLDRVVAGVVAYEAFGRGGVAVWLSEKRGSAGVYRAGRTRWAAFGALAALAALGVGLPALLAATSILVAAVGVAVAGIGAIFPLTSSLHVNASPGGADGALGQVLSVTAIGEIAGPLTAGAIAQAAGLRAGLLMLPALTLIAAAGLYRHHRSSRRTAQDQQAPFRNGSSHAGEFPRAPRR